MDVKTELKDKKFIYRATVGEKEKRLVFDYDKCCGCSICVDACPTSAIELGPIFEIATGMDAPPIMIDEHKCSFCGMCAAFCPYNAIKMEDISEDYPHLQSSIEVNDSKCLPCKLCERVCDSDAIKVTFDMPKKEDLVLYRKMARGEIIVDRDKCNFCGICAEFCDAFFLLEKTPTPLDLRPYEDLLIDEDKCDYCGLCVDLCPEEAIKVISMAKVAIRIRLKGEIEIDEEKCTKCGKCQEICPYDAIKVEKPMEGAIKLIKNHLGRCDPIGCHACINICPNKAWYVSPDKEEKVGVNEDYCIYCGACEEACWVNAIDVRRDDVKHTEIQKRYPWSKSWEDGIEAIKGKERERPDLSRIVTAEKVEEEKKIVEEEELPVIDEKSVDKAVKSIEDVISTLKNKKVRFFWEKGDARTKDEVLKRIKKEKKKKP
ncbi:MAG: 4Fe-4S dicluster domain-containing protein [Candidatus Methanolliviera hydrocarbonicum]|uniref:4Fe-4S dicluster domain-containing protein n=1 Tax=Candidatus Methanolliviera hydrocarbonicum TaxID=2491085 RepID=A0A520KWV7_9EURY|nr:MAG: 4Fe-4S dicluster domain-containing protein [Candidatus Methanolliviera hydrocarbonicum]